MINTEIEFHTHNSETKPSYTIMPTTKKFEKLIGLSIPSGICFNKNNSQERGLNHVSGSDDCIPEDLYNKLFNLACYVTPLNTKKRKTLKFKKSKLNTSNKNKK